MQLFFTDQRKVWRVGQVAGLSRTELSALFERRLLPTGTPILLDEAMQPVEPVSSWIRSLALERKAAKTMRSYAYSVLMLLHFLLARQADLQSATESDLREFRLWRQEEAEEVVDDAAWDRDWAAIESLYRFLIRIGTVARQPWRATPQRSSLASRIRPDLRVRHMELDQYLYLRDVGFGGLAPDAGLDESFRGWRPHRNRAACELALMTGMRVQEWSTLLLPELGLLHGLRPAYADVHLKACAKLGRPRSVYVGPDPMELLGPYLLLERPEIVAKAQRSLRRRCRELFVIQRLEADGTRVRGVLDGVTITRTVKNMKPDLRRLAVRETGDGLDPLALFIGQGGRMLTFSAWDKIRWRAWDRLKAWSGHRRAPVLPRRCWVYHDLRHTFALRLLIFLTREALNDAEAQGLPMSTLLDHMSGNPLLVVQRRLGHAHPSTTYRYINPRELHQMGEKPQVAWSLGEAEPVRRVYGLAS
ncbi:tyrosine-type recombinase/integrase [Streptomyces bluensis]|uniref:tyrosine-type recombinase/integrase n=1 Tax=Streptomyces bluensis TaxID=33897 RepID=UPI003316A9F0